jgi:hypothetical protein
MGCCHDEGMKPIMYKEETSGKSWTNVSGHLLKRFLTISTSRENKKPIDRSFREKNYKQMYEASNYPVEPHIKNPKL